MGESFSLTLLPETRSPKRNESSLCSRMSPTSVRPATSSVPSGSAGNSAVNGSTAFMRSNARLTGGQGRHGCCGGRKGGARHPREYRLDDAGAPRYKKRQVSTEHLWYRPC